MWCECVVVLTQDVTAGSVIDGIICQTTLKNFLQEMEIERKEVRVGYKETLKQSCVLRILQYITVAIPAAHYCGRPCSTLVKQSLQHISIAVPAAH